MDETDFSALRDQLSSLVTSIESRIDARMSGLAANLGIANSAISNLRDEVRNLNAPQIAGSGGRRPSGTPIPAHATGSAVPHNAAVRQASLLADGASKVAAYAHDLTHATQSIGGELNKAKELNNELRSLLKIFRSGPSGSGAGSRLREFATTGEFEQIVGTLSQQLEDFKSTLARPGNIPNARSSLAQYSQALSNYELYKSIETQALAGSFSVDDNDISSEFNLGIGATHFAGNRTTRESRRLTLDRFRDFARQNPGMASSFFQEGGYGVLRNLDDNSILENDLKAEIKDLVVDDYAQRFVAGTNLSNLRERANQILTYEYENPISSIKEYEEQEGPAGKPFEDVEDGPGEPGGTSPVPPVGGGGTGGRGEGDGSEGVRFKRMDAVRDYLHGIGFTPGAIKKLGYAATGLVTNRNVQAGDIAALTEDFIKQAGKDPALRAEVSGPVLDAILGFRTEMGEVGFLQQAGLRVVDGKLIDEHGVVQTEDPIKRPSRLGKGQQFIKTDEYQKRIGTEHVIGSLLEAFGGNVSTPDGDDDGGNLPEGGGGTGDGDGGGGGGVGVGEIPPGGGSSGGVGPRGEGHGSRTSPSYANLARLLEGNEYVVPSMVYGIDSKIRQSLEFSESQRRRGKPDKEVDEMLKGIVTDAGGLKDLRKKLEDNETRLADLYKKETLEGTPLTTAEKEEQELLTAINSLIHTLLKTNSSLDGSSENTGTAIAGLVASVIGALSIQQFMMMHSVQQPYQYQTQPALGLMGSTGMMGEALSGAFGAQEAVLQSYREFGVGTAGNIGAVAGGAAGFGLASFLPPQYRAAGRLVSGALGATGFGAFGTYVGIKNQDSIAALLAGDNPQNAFNAAFASSMLNAQKFSQEFLLPTMQARVNLDFLQGDNPAAALAALTEGEDMLGARSLGYDAVVSSQILGAGLSMLRPDLAPRDAESSKDLIRLVAQMEGFGLSKEAAFGMLSTASAAGSEDLGMFVDRMLLATADSGQITNFTANVLAPALAKVTESRSIQNIAKSSEQVEKETAAFYSFFRNSDTNLGKMLGANPELMSNIFGMLDQVSESALHDPALMLFLNRMGVTFEDIMTGSPEALLAPMRLFSQFADYDADGSINLGSMATHSSLVGFLQASGIGVNRNTLNVASQMFEAMNKGGGALGTGEYEYYMEELERASPENRLVVVLEQLSGRLDDIANALGSDVQRSIVTETNKFFESMTENSSKISEVQEAVLALISNTGAMSSRLETASDAMIDTIYSILGIERQKSPSQDDPPAGSSVKGEGTSEGSGFFGRLGTALGNVFFPNRREKTTLGYESDYEAETIAERASAFTEGLSELQKVIFDSLTAENQNTIRNAFLSNPTEFDYTAAFDGLLDTRRLYPELYSPDIENFNISDDNSNSLFAQAGRPAGTHFDVDGNLSFYPEDLPRDLDFSDLETRGSLDLPEQIRELRSLGMELTPLENLYLNQLDANQYDIISRSMMGLPESRRRNFMDFITGNSYIPGLVSGLPSGYENIIRQGMTGSFYHDSFSTPLEYNPLNSLGQISRRPDELLRRFRNIASELPEGSTLADLLPILHSFSADFIQNNLTSDPSQTQQIIELFNNALSYITDVGTLDFATGGYTGSGGRLDAVGVVHGGEYVISDNNVSGNFNTLQKMQAGEKMDGASSFTTGSTVSGDTIRVTLEFSNTNPDEIIHAAKMSALSMLREERLL